MLNLVKVKWALNLAVCSLLIASCNGKSGINIQSTIDSITVKYVPDKRIGLCEIKTEIADDGTLILKGETTIGLVKSDLIKTLNSQGILFTDSILILPDTIKNRNYFGLVTLSVANLRKNPAHSSELVSQSILGTPLMILKQENSWLLVQTPDGYIAWTEGSSVKMLNKAQLNIWKKAARIIYLKNSGYVYSTPDEKDITGDLVGGALIEKLGESGRYVAVKYPDGRGGFIRKTESKDFFLWKEDTGLTAENLVSTAFTYKGLPYLWGGSSTKAVDCSGFMQSVFFRNGVILQRDASLQAKHGKAIYISKDFSELLTGDLLFFGSSDDRGQHVTHVAMYIGNSEFINASSVVMINSLDSTKGNYSGYRKKSLLSARRIIGVKNDAGIVPVSEHSWYR